MRGCGLGSCTRLCVFQRVHSKCLGNYQSVRGFTGVFLSFLCICGSVHVSIDCVCVLVRILCPCHFACWFPVCPKPVPAYVCACVQVGAHMCVCKSLLLLCKTMLYICACPHVLRSHHSFMSWWSIFGSMAVSRKCYCVCFFSIRVDAEFVLCELVCLCVCLSSVELQHISNWEWHNREREIAWAGSSAG